MQIVAKLNNLRLAPRKVRLVADLIRRKTVAEAETILTFTIKRGAPIILKLLKQAVANAKNNFQLNEADLYVGKITVDEGPKLKRFRPRARGSASPIQKKTSHITLILESTKSSVKVAKKAKTEEKPEAVETKEEKTDKKAPKQKFKTEKEKVQKQIQAKEAKRIFRRKAF